MWNDGVIGTDLILFSFTVQMEISANKIACFIQYNYNISLLKIQKASSFVRIL